MIKNRETRLVPPLRPDLPMTSYSSMKSLATTLLVLLGGAVSGCEPQSVECDFDFNCDDGETCIAGLCVGPDEDVSVDASLGDAGDTSIAACVEDDERVSATPCGLNGRGVSVDVCASGAWVPTDRCDDPDRCEDGATATSPDACGSNGRGTLVELCTEGVWTFERCDDPDRCADGDTTEVASACGYNGTGTATLSCDDGSWRASACDDPDACRDGELREVDGECGMNGRGLQHERCDAGAWVTESCDEVDVCVDEEVQLALCWDRTASRDQVCEAGRWQDASGCVDGLEGVDLGFRGEFADGGASTVALSATGRYAIFSATGTNMVSHPVDPVAQIYRRDLGTGVLEAVLPGDVGAYQLSASSDALTVAFVSGATGLSDLDDDSVDDVYVWGPWRTTPTLVTRGVDGAPANGDSLWPRVSSSGRFVAYASIASNLVYEDTNDRWDAFVTDLSTGVTRRVNVGPDGEQSSSWGTPSPRVSDDGRYVAFVTSISSLTGDPEGGSHSVLRDLHSGTTEIVTLSADGDYREIAGVVTDMSPDARFFVFQSDSAAVVDGDTNAARDVFVRDRLAGTTRRVSETSGGEQLDGASYGGQLSDDGRWVVFASEARNVVEGLPPGQAEAYARDMATGQLYWLSSDYLGGVGLGTVRSVNISGDGSHAVFVSEADELLPSDTNGHSDAFITSIRGER